MSKKNVLLIVCLIMFIALFSFAAVERYTSSAKVLKDFNVEALTSGDDGESGIVVTACLPPWNTGGWGWDNFPAPPPVVVCDLDSQLDGVPRCTGDEEVPDFGVSLSSCWEFICQ